VSSIGREGNGLRRLAPVALVSSAPPYINAIGCAKPTTNSTTTRTVDKPGMCTISGLHFMDGAQVIYQTDSRHETANAEVWSPNLIRCRPPSDAFTEDAVDLLLINPDSQSFFMRRAILLLQRPAPTPATNSTNLVRQPSTSTPHTRAVSSPSGSGGVVGTPDGVVGQPSETREVVGGSTDLPEADVDGRYMSFGPVATSWSSKTAAIGVSVILYDRGLPIVDVPATLVRLEVVEVQKRVGDNKGLNADNKAVGDNKNALSADGVGSGADTEFAVTWREEPTVAGVVIFRNLHLPPGTYVLRAALILTTGNALLSGIPPVESLPFVVATSPSQE
jgi:hypothetical protein